MASSNLRIFILVIVLIFSTRIFPSGSGKIAGKITDKETGEPLIGVNIVLIGTTMGAASGNDGRYFIIGVSPETYTLKVSMIGYHTVTVKNVTVRADLTTEIDVQLEPASIQTPTVVVTAHQNIIQKDVTNTERTITRADFKNVPGLQSTADIFKLQGGTVISSTPQLVPLGDTQLQVRDQSVKDIHIRGGRGGEILFLVDGMPVTHPLYGGRAVLNLDVNSVQQVQLITGAFNAEYGEAQSGVVNITTRTGSNKHIGGIQYKNDSFRFLGEDYQTQYSTLYLGGPEPITRNLLPSIGINVPGKFYYFLNATINMTNTPYNNHRIRHQINLFGFNLKEEQDNSATFMGKINWDISKNNTIIASYNGNWHYWSQFEWLWNYFPNNTPDYKRFTNEVSVLYRHIFSPSTFMNIRFGYLGVIYKDALNNQTPADFWTIQKTANGWSAKSSIKDPYYDPLTGFYASDGYLASWENDNTSTYTLIANLTSQVLPDHLIKMGTTVKYNDLSYIDIEDGGTKLSNYGEYLYNNGPKVPPPPGPFPEFGQYRWVFHTYPLIGSAYIQDKFEKEFLIINAGVRMDWFYLGQTVNSPQWKQQWQDATGFNPDFKLFKYAFSPRFGISFPISTNMVTYFSYGHFIQLPELQFYYRDPYSGSFTGNPNLNFEETIQYEFGLTYRLGTNWGLDIKSYAKDISKQVGTTQLKSNLGIPVQLYDNVGYARARGLEFTLNKLYSNFISGKLTYTVQWAYGYSSSAFADYIRSLTDFPKPIRETRLDWDIRDQIVFQGTISSPKDKHINLFGWELPDNWSLTVLSNFSSGQPYTPGTFSQADAQKLANSATGPITTETDVRFTKDFLLFGGVNLGLELDVFNVFDQRNVQLAYGFNNWTGKPFKYGDIEPGTNVYYDWYTMYKLMDPMQFSTGRYAQFGLSIDW